MSKCSYELIHNLTNKDVLTLLVQISDRGDSLCSNQEDRKVILNILHELNRGYVDSFSVINEWVKIKGIKPPLQLLWALDKDNLLKFTTYLYYNKEYCMTVNRCFSNTLINGDDNEEHQEEIKKILIYILGVIMNVRSCIYFQVISENILTSVVQKVIECFESHHKLKWLFLHDLKKLKTIDQEMLTKYMLENLMALLSYEDASLTLLYTLNQHTKLWTLDKLPEEMNSFLQEILTGLDSQIVLKTINNIVQLGSFNWKYLLSSMSVFIQHQKNSEMMKGIIDEWLKNAVEEKNKNLLLASLIIARHCCAERARYFNNYPHWFSSLNLKSVPVFTFFFECLTQIVPNEPPLFLKIHINKVPSVPSSCRKSLTEYITLCKTRLSDLNETTDYIGIFNDYYETDEEGQEADVLRAISIFQDTREIPKPLLEASVFRKQYYEKVFLKRLLSVPESCDASRAELIKKLHSAGKISNTVFNRWLSLSVVNK